MTKEQEVIKRLNFHKEYARLSSNRVVISETDLETVLNMLKAQQRKIKTLTQTNRSYKGMIRKKDKEIEKYKTLYSKALDDATTAGHENIQLKKQIDLMAETIRKLAISLASYEGSYNKETINFTGNIKDIKQYFERKVNHGI